MPDSLLRLALYKSLTYLSSDVYCESKKSQKKYFNRFLICFMHKQFLRTTAYML